MQRFEDAETRALRPSDAEDVQLFLLDEAAGDWMPTLGRYQILSELGRGGMGVVFRARDPDLDRTVAIKVLRAGPDANEDRLRRFQIEAKAAASLSHPNLVSVYEVGHQGDLHYLAMDLVEGHRLDDDIPVDGMDPARAARIVAAVARAAHAAHQGGIVHRDLKPGNIILDREDQPHVTDFGLAKAMGSTTHVTAAGLVMGTPEYMAPEQIDPEAGAIDPRTDVYALGALLYEMVTGHTPFEDPELRALLARIVYGDPLPPRRRRPGLPADLQAIILKALSREPAGRYRSAEALAQDLECYLDGLPVSARRLAPLSALRRLLRRRRETVAVAVIFLVLLGVLVMVGLRRRMRIEEIGRLQVEVASLSSRSPQDDRIPVLLQRLRSLEGASAQEALLRGRWHQAAGRLEQALGAFEEALELEPDHLPTLESRAPVLLERARELEVDLDWLLGRAIFEARPLPRLAQPRRAQLDLITRQVAADLAAIARLQPAHPLAAVHRVRQLAEGASDQGQLEAALRVLDAAPGNPPPIEVQLHRVQVLERLHLEEEVERELDAIVTRTESRADCVRARAQHRLRGGLWDQALADLAVLLTRDPRDAAALRCQAICQFLSKRHEETYQTFAILADLHPEDPDCQWNVADAARRANQLLEARRRVSQLLEMAPGDVDAQGLHIHILHLMGLHREALEELAAARERLGDPGAFLDIEAFIRFDFERDYPRAVELFQALTRQSRPDVLHLWYLGASYMLTGEYENAMTTFLDAYEYSNLERASPQVRRLRENTEGLLRGLDELDLSRLMPMMATFETNLEALGESSPSIKYYLRYFHMLVGRMHQELGHHLEATRSLSRALGLPGQKALRTYELAQAYCGAGDLESSLDALEDAIDAGYRGVERMRQDTTLAPLRREFPDDYEQIRARMTLIPE